MYTTIFKFILTKRPTACYVRCMGKNLVPPVRIRLKQEQYTWLMEYVERNGTNVNALVKTLINKEMVNDKNNRGN